MPKHTKPLSGKMGVHPRDRKDLLQWVRQGILLSVDWSEKEQLFTLYLEDTEYCITMPYTPMEMAQFIDVLSGAAKLIRQKRGELVPLVERAPDGQLIAKAVGQPQSKKAGRLDLELERDRQMFVLSMLGPDGLAQKFDLTYSHAHSLAQWILQAPMSTPASLVEAAVHGENQ